MSDLYMDTQTKIVNKTSSARECALCYGTARPTSAVWLEKAGVVLCQDCAHDLAERLTPKAEIIPVTPVRKSTMPYQPFEQKRTAELIKQEMYDLLLAERMRQGANRS